MSIRVNVRNGARSLDTSFTVPDGCVPMIGDVVRLGSPLQNWEVRRREWIEVGLQLAAVDVVVERV